MSSDEVRTVANHGFVPVATLAETNDDDLDLTPPLAPISALNHVDRGRLLSAALRVKKIHPDPIGTLVAEHLTSYSEFGWRFGGDSTIAKLVDHVMRLPVDDEPLAAA
jgi:hypothetical protein